MRRALAVAGWLLTTAGASGAALGCSPATHSPSQRAETGPGCAWHYRVNEIDSVSLEGLSDLGGGYLSQVLREGNGCYAEISVIVINCTSGDGVLYGPDRLSPTATGARQTVFPLAQALRKSDRPLTRARLEALVRAAGVTNWKQIPKGSALRFGQGVQLPLDCGCRTLKPGQTN